MNENEITKLLRARNHKQAVEILTDECQAGSNRKLVFDLKEYASVFAVQADVGRILGKSAPHVNQIIKSEENNYVVIEVDRDVVKLYREV